MFPERGHDIQGVGLFRYSQGRLATIVFDFRITADFQQLLHSSAVVRSCGEMQWGIAPIILSEIVRTKCDERSNCR